MIRVLIRASSLVVRAGLTSLLGPYAQFELVEEQGDADSGDEHLEQRQPDVILSAADDDDPADQAIDPYDRLPGGASLILLVRGPTAPWAVALRRGARAVLPGNATAAQIAAAIEAVAAGLVVIDADEIDQLLPLPAANQPADRLVEPLTPREIEVLRAMAEGLANKEIAARLGISENTVKFHVGSVLGKLGAGSRTEAVTMGIRRGLVLL